MVVANDRDVEILEVKFDSYFPSHIRALLADITGERCAISKYVMCRRYQPLGERRKAMGIGYFGILPGGGLALFPALASRPATEIRHAERFSAQTKEEGFPMNSSDILNLFSSQTIGTSSIPLVLFSVVLAFAVGLGIAAVYRMNFRGVMYSSNFTLTLVLMTLITTPVVMCIRESIQLSMGMVGALSIVRLPHRRQGPAGHRLHVLGADHGHPSGRGAVSAHRRGGREVKPILPC